MQKTVSKLTGTVHRSLHSFAITTALTSSPSCSGRFSTALHSSNNSPKAFSSLPSTKNLLHAIRACTTMAAAPNANPEILRIERVPCLSDNYAWILHEPSSGATAVVDPAEVSPVVEALRQHGWELTHILNTHHHADHTGGNLALKKRYNCVIVGPAADRDRIPGIDVELKDGDLYKLGALEFVCFDTPGHTRGHVSFHFPAAEALFPGDTLFSLGCGRLFEGTPQQMWASLSKLVRLPQETLVYCAHEYTQSNARFAAAVDPTNELLKKRKEDIDAARSRGQPTVPSFLGDEIRTNPFLRPFDPSIRAALGVPMDASDDVAFAAIRAAKDSFR